MKYYGEVKVRLSTTISPSLRQYIEEAREESGRTLTDEVEARIRDSLNARSTDGLVLLKLDPGMMAWLTAIDKMRFFGISFEDCVIHMLRTAMIGISDHDAWFVHIVDALPEPWRTNCRNSPRYERLKKHLDREKRRGEAVWPFSQIKEDQDDGTA